MKKVLSIVLALALIVGLMSAVGLSASAETISVARLTQTATNVKLNANLTEQQAETFAAEYIPEFSNMGAFIYADLGNGQYKYIMDGQFGISDNTGSIASIFADNCMRCVYINGTFDDKYVGVDASTLTNVKNSGSVYNYAVIPELGTITPFEVPNVINFLNAQYSAASSTIFMFKLYIADNSQTDWVVTFTKEDAVDEFEQSQYYAPSDLDGWNTFADNYGLDDLGTVISTMKKTEYTLLDTPKAAIDLSKAGATATFRSEAAITKFAAVAVDNVVIDAANYTVTEGSTIITLKNEYLLTLADGNHKITILSVDGACDASFTTANAGKLSPKTGDNTTLLVSLMAISALAVLVIGKKRVEVK